MHLSRPPTNGPVRLSALLGQVIFGQLSHHILHLLLSLNAASPQALKHPLRYLDIQSPRFFLGQLFNPPDRAPPDGRHAFRDSEERAQKFAQYGARSLGDPPPCPRRDPPCALCAPAHLATVQRRRYLMHLLG